jgi:hypothetical protein
MQTKLIFSREDSHVNPIHKRENEKAKKMNAIYGPKCLEQYGRLNQSTSWGKMFLDSLIGMGEWYSTRCILTWSLRGTKSRPWLYLRRRSMPHTEGTEFGSLLPTPTWGCYQHQRHINTCGNGKATEGRKDQGGRIEPLGFNMEWDNFPTQSPICGGDDGIPTELDGITFSKWRNESIKAYGNAIVPQVAYEIFKAIQRTI